MLEVVSGCFMTCNICLAGNSEVSSELQCFKKEECREAVRGAAGQTLGANFCYTIGNCEKYILSMK